LDAAHFVYGAFLGMMWCLRRVLLPTPAGRQRVSVLAGLNALTHELITVVTDGSVNRFTVCQILDKIAALKYTVPITIVLDNARYQYCKQVREYAAALHIELLFLPPYSPHLNLIERVWRLVKKQCLYNQYYPNFQAFRATIVQFIETASVKHTQALNSLLTLNFQSFREVKVAIR
jgi:transposase